MQTKFSAQAKQQKGFTLIELIVVIVILGILAATALPKFYDLSAEAKAAKSAGVAGAISSSAAIQYATSLVRPAVVYATASACSGAYLEGGAYPANCAGALVGNSCTVTCDAVAATAVTLP